MVDVLPGADNGLVEWLRFAVPAYLQELMSSPDRELRTQQWTLAAGRMVGHRGDLLQFTDHRPDRRPARGKVALVVEQLGRGLAALAASTPGGITVRGEFHICADRSCLRCRRPAPIDPAQDRALVARLDELEDDFRRLTGMPPRTVPSRDAMFDEEAS